MDSACTFPVFFVFKAGTSLVGCACVPSGVSKMAAEILRFEDFELDRSAYELRRAGTGVHLQRIPFQLLSLLVERRGQLVTREEILACIWGRGVFVDSENAIRTAVRKIRRALNDDADAPRFVITVPAKGYRFVAPISLRPSASSVAIYDAPNLPLPLPDKPSIAVLPFTNMSGDRDQEYFSDGMTDDLITALSRLPDLFVIARTSTFTYKGKAAKVQDIGRELGVAYVLEGSVRKAGDNVRITAQLVDASSGDHLWAEHYDRPLKDIFSLQDEIVHRIVTTLKLQLPLDPQWKYSGFSLTPHTDNPEAYDDFLRGEEYVLTLSAKGVPKSKEMFEKAIELDPAYTDAYASLGYTYFQTWESQYGGDDPAVLDRAIGLEEKAIALDDTHAYAAHAFLCRFYPYKRQYDQAVTECQRAIELAPSFIAGYIYSYFLLVSSGKPQEAIRFIEKTERLDPRNRILWEGVRGEAYIVMGRYAEAIPIFKAYIVRVPHQPWPHVWLTVAYSELGREQEARAQIAEILRISPHFSLKRGRH